MANVGLIQDEQIFEEMPLVDVKFTHSLCIGQTGSGKTSSYIYPNLKHRMEMNHGILFFDIKGNEHFAIKNLAKDAGRLQDVVEIGKPWGRNINILNSLNERKFYDLLIKLVGNPAQGGSNTYFYLEAIALGLNIYQMYKIRSIIIQELGEIEEILKKEGKPHDIFHSKIKIEQEFTLKDLYLVSRNMDTIYAFVQENKEFMKNVHTFLQDYGFLYPLEHAHLYKNIALNYAEAQEISSWFSKFDYEQKKRDRDEGFDISLISVINSLSGGFNFMATSSASYIAEKEDPFNIVEALQESKIIIINVRVIPDIILEILLEQMFEEMIDLNLKDEAKRTPTSIFIDEAQRLINKNMPLDVLRSSKVDVLMAVQSELQLLSKFRTHEDWQQISINIAQKFSFHSSVAGSAQLANFHVDTSVLRTFEFVKEGSNRVYTAKPIFLDKSKFEEIEYAYQKDILKLEDAKDNKILFYDVSHFEKEREVIYVDIKTKKKTYAKVFTKQQEEAILSIVKEYIVLPASELLKSRYLKNIDDKEKYKRMHEQLSIRHEEDLLQCAITYNYQLGNDIQKDRLMRFPSKLAFVKTFYLVYIDEKLFPPLPPHTEFDNLDQPDEESYELPQLDDIFDEAIINNYDDHFELLSELIDSSSCFYSDNSSLESYISKFPFRKHQFQDDNKRLKEIVFDETKLDALLIKLEPLCYLFKDKDAYIAFANPKSASFLFKKRWFMGRFAYVDYDTERRYFGFEDHNEIRRLLQQHKKEENDN
jgi:hypothetical protein